MRLLRRGLVAVALAGAAPVSAATIFDNGMPTGAGGYSVFFFNTQIYQGYAARFTVAQPTRISGIEAFFFPAVAGRDEVDLTLRSSTPGVVGQPFGAAIASSRIVIPSAGNGDWAGAFYDGPVLTAGDYWLTFTVDPSNAAKCDCFLRAGAPSKIPVGAYTNNFTGTNWLERDFDFGFRVFGDSAAAVPEPGQWALLIAGFGMVGGVLRRRRDIVRLPIQARNVAP